MTHHYYKAKMYKENKICKIKNFIYLNCYVMILNHHSFPVSVHDEKINLFQHVGDTLFRLIINVTRIITRQTGD